MNNVGTYNQVEFNVRRVFYNGTATLAEGQILCFQDNPATTATDRSKGFPFDVQTPDSGNAKVFAGIVAEESIGKTGPCFIDIVVPRAGDILKVKVGRQADVAVDSLLRLNYITGTVSSLSTLGAFEHFSTAVVSSTDFTVALQIALVKAIDPLCRALESVASTTADSSLTSLVYVKFI